MKKISVAAAAVGVLFLGWWYFQMPSPSVAGLTRPSLSLMATEEGAAAAPGSKIGPRPAAPRNAAKPNLRDQKTPRKPFTRPSRVKPGDLNADNRDQVNPPGAAPGRRPFDRAEWQKRRREAMERRMNRTQGNSPIGGLKSNADQMGEEPEPPVLPDEEGPPLPPMPDLPPAADEGPPGAPGDEIE